MMNEWMKKQTEERTNAQELCWRRINISLSRTNFHSANICTVRVMHQAQGWVLWRLLVFPSHPRPYSRIQLGFFTIHCSISTQHLLLSAFSHELETWVNFHCHGHILIRQGVLAVLESWRESFFLYIFDVKIWDLILYIADLWPTTVGNNYQLATSLPSKPLTVQKGLSPEHNLGEGAQPAFLSSLPSCQHFKWETRPVSDQEEETGTFWNWEETYINQQPDHII